MKGPSSLSPLFSTTEVDCHCTASPHNLFKDGILIIYSYLSTADWSHAFQTCRHWYSVTTHERCRHISLNVDVGADAVLLPPSHLIHHITSFHSRPESDASFRRVSQFITLIRSLPHLASITGHFDQTVEDVSNWFHTEIDWPVCLTSLTINTINEDIMIPLVRSLIQVPQLRRLTLLPTYSDFHFERFFSRVVTPPMTVVGQHPTDSTSTHSLSLTSPRYMNWFKLTSQLIEMNIFHGRSFARLIPPGVNGAWSKLQHMDLTHCDLKGGELEQLHSCAPNLRQLSPRSFWLTRRDFEVVALFRSLETIRVYFQVANSDDRETVIVNTLLKCTNLTDLQLVNHSMLLKPESWSSLCSSHLRTQLIHLEIHWSSFNCLPGFPPIELEKVVSQFTELRSLHIVLGEGVDEDTLKISFNSPHVLTKLRRFVLTDDYERIRFSWNLDQGINVNNYRRPRLVTTTKLTNTSVTVPAARLVGIELNPGPWNSISTTSAGLFKDGLHLIYSYLPSKDWFACICTSRYWRSCGVTQPEALDLLYTFIPGCPVTHLPPPHIRRHIRRFVYEKVKATQLVIVLNHLTNLTTINCKLTADFTTIDKRMCTWPKGLTDITFSTDSLVTNFTCLFTSMTSQLAQSLLSLQLLGMNSNDISCLSSLSDLNVLTNLHVRLRYYGDDSVDVIRRVGWNRLPHSLTHLNLCNGHNGALSSIHILSPLSNLTHLHMGKWKWGDLERYHRVAPNLTILEPSFFSLEEFHSIQLFQSSLQTIHFQDSHSLEPDEELHLITSLSGCPNLTRLIFDDLILSPEGLIILATMIPQLKHLSSRSNSIYSVYDRLFTTESFLNLESLMIQDYWFESEIATKLKDWFNERSICPKLTYLSIRVYGSQAKAKPFFEFDLAKGINTNNYRLLPNTTLVTTNNSTTDDVTSNHGLLTLTHALELINNIPPSPPLIGVEPNPGPFESESRSAASFNATSRYVCTPGNLFKDGLFIIYSFLSTRDWSHAYQICRHWYYVATIERCRNASFPVHLNGESILLPPKRLVHHFTSFHFPPVRGISTTTGSFKRSSHFLTLIHALSYLTSISVLFDRQSKHDVKDMSNIIWPKSLVSLTLSCVPEVDEHERLNYIVDSHVTLMIELVQSLKDVPLLTHLTLLPTYFGYDFEQFLNGVVLPSPRYDSSAKRSDDSSSHLIWFNLTQQLIRLNVFHGCQFTRMIPQAKWLKLQHMDLLHYRLESGDLTLLHKCAPNLVELKPASGFNVNDFGVIAQFQSLHTIRITTDSNYHSSFESSLAPTLVKCKNLTNLQLPNWMPIQPNTWNELSSSHLGQQLTHLEIMWSKTEYIDLLNRSVGIEPITLEVFHPFVRLQSFILRTRDGMKPEPLKSHFDSLAILPNLRRFVLININKKVQFEWNLDQAINVHSYRIPPKLHVKKVDVPAARLVGVEENPGPTSSRDPVIRRLSAQTIFNDGLYLIYSYLTPHDFIASLCTCHHWSSCGASSPSLHLPWTIISADAPIPPPPVRLRHHFTKIICSTHDQISQSRRGRRERKVSMAVSELISIGRILPGLRTIDCQVRDSPTPTTPTTTPINPSPYLCSWPSTLTSLSMDVEPCNLEVPLLIRAILHGCTNLIRLRFKGLRINPDHLAAFSKLHQLTELKSFRMYFTRADQSKSCDVLREMKFSRLPLKLTQLDINGGERGIFVLKSLAQLPPSQLQEISVSTFKVGDLECLVVCAPHLKTIMVTQCPLPDLVTLAKFDSLQAIHFAPPYSVVRDQVQLTPPLNDEYESYVINGLINCHHLTCLSFCAWSPTSLTSWLRLSESCGKKLLRLEFIWTHPPSLDSLRPFESLRTLRFKCITSRAKFTNIQNYFRSSEVLPNLQLLELTASNLHSDWACPPWSWSKESKNNDAEDYRTDQLPQTHLLEPSSVTVPAARLVGIETNPGPTGSIGQQLNPSLTPHSPNPIPSSIGIPVNTSPEQSEHIVGDAPWSLEPSPSPKSQTLFRDGLHQIYSYLNHHDWSFTLRTCHHWYEVTQSEPSRHLSGYLFMDLQQLSKSPLCHHFDSITNGQAISNEIQIDHQELPTLFRLLPKLHSLEIKPLAPIDESNLKSSPPTASRIKWKFPKNLTDLSINFINYTKFIQFIPIIFQATQLKKLSLLQLPVCDSSDFKGLKDLIHLTSFSITKNSNLNYIPPDLFQLLTQTQLGQLKYLNLFEGHQNGLLKYLFKMKLPQMIELNLESVILEEKELTSLCTYAPNIQILRCRCLPLFGLSDLVWRLGHLHTLSFHDAPHWRRERQRPMIQFGYTDDDNDGSDYDSGDEDEDNKIIYAITKCHQLRTLEFKDCTIDSRYFGLSELIELNLTTLSFGESWSLEDAVDFALPFHNTLTSLTIDTRFRWDRDQRSIQSIKDLKELKYLKLIQHTTHAKTDSTIDYIRDYFNSCHICPALLQLLLYQFSSGGRMSDVFEFDRRKQIHNDLNEYRFQTSVVETTISVTHESDHEPSNDEDEHDDKEKRSGPMKNKNKKKHKK